MDTARFEPPIKADPTYVYPPRIERLRQRLSGLNGDACNLLEIACEITAGDGIALIGVKDYRHFHSDDHVRLALAALEICGLGNDIHTVEHGGKIVDIHLTIHEEPS